MTTRTYTQAVQVFPICDIAGCRHTREAGQAVRDAQAVKVKPLVWARNSYGMPETIKTIVGIYRVNNAKNGGYGCSIGLRGPVMYDADGRSNFISIQAAKAAAQADYEGRILSALSGDPATVEAVQAQERERCARIAEGHDAGFLAAAAIREGKDDG